MYITLSQVTDHFPLDVHIFEKINVKQLHILASGCVLELNITFSVT